MARGYYNRTHTHGKLTPGKVFGKTRQPRTPGAGQNTTRRPPPGDSDPAMNLVKKMVSSRVSPPSGQGARIPKPVVNAQATRKPMKPIDRGNAFGGPDDGRRKPKPGRKPIPPSAVRGTRRPGGRIYK